MAAEGQTGSKMLDEMPEYRIFELLKKYHLFVKKLCRPGAVEKDALCMYNERRKRAKKGDAR